MTTVPGAFAPPPRILLGPGPSDVHPRVLAAMAAPLVGHLDPVFVAMMEEVKALLRFVFATRNPLTIPISGTGSAGMEACVVNLVEPGDEVVVGVNGVFGTRLAEVAARAGAVVVRVETAWGRVVRAEQVEAALRSCRRPKVVALIHAETSTGAWQPLEDAVRLAHDHGALFLADCVTSLGGVPVEIDGWGIDAAYSGTQKCLSCPPGLAPLTFGARAVEALQRRKTPVQSWYLDLTLLQRYWGEERVYHHTAPISMNYALREALRLVAEEGLAARFTRHRLNHEALAAGLGSLGLAFAAEEGHCLPMLNAVTVPEGVDEARVRRRLLEAHGIEVGGGLGPMKGRVWRIGLMGESSRRAHVLLLLSALEDALRAEGRSVAPGAAVGAAQAAYAA
ncbi:MAG: alanine--glyoxylate aminotransferase family protein [Deltaproteobacteria bacterium]|nr:MAG: alanine--glyoxylate aminotransferase family protein [Deltaproteobacteria bacterium]